jgi:pimeloyl-ACP methyl ester carboxylesterase
MSSLITVPCAPGFGQPVQVEFAFVGEATATPLLVFLHEGLGSLAMWRDFPAQLCAAVGARGLVYSRPGYGRSSPRAASEPLGTDFMHRQATELLPALLDALGIHAAQTPFWLIGHSDGGSIALLYAAHFANSARQPAGLVVMAPHIVVEDISITSIQKARVAFETADLRARLGRYHDDVDSAFWGWNGIWLNPQFRNWSIEREISAIRCPVLAVQGLDDEYGTLEQIRGIARRVPSTELLELPHCGHSAHRDQTQTVIEACTSFMARSKAPPGLRAFPSPLSTETNA